MNVSFQHFSPNVPDKDRYEHGIDYLSHEFDLNFEDAFYLIQQLRNNHSSVRIQAPGAFVDFYISDDELNVQVEGYSEGLWVATHLDLDAAREILRVAFEGGEDFGEFIPGTNRYWDVY